MDARAEIIVGQNRRADLLAEYSESNQNIRHYINLRFAILTVFIAINAAIISSFKGVDDAGGIESYIINGSPILGIFASLVFGYMEYNANAYINNFQKRAREIEKELRFGMWEGIFNDYTLMKTNTTTLSIYVITLTSWIVIGLWILNSKMLMV